MAASTASTSRTSPKTLNTTPDDIVARHVAGDYRVAMIGFTPGWSYLSGLDDSLHMPRRQNPRLLTPAGTISIGGVQTGVQCLAGPSGWHLLGRTAGPHLPAAPRSRSSCWSPATPSRFTPVDAKTFAEQDRAAEAGEIIAELMRVMSKLVISSIGPASSVQDGGRPGAQRYGLMPSGAMDRLALAAANTLVGNELFAAAIEIGPFGAAFTARGGAVRIALAGASRNADIAGRAVAHRYVDDACRWRDADARLCPRRLVQLPRDRGRHRGRADVRQPRRECRAPASAAPIRARCRAATNCRRRAASGAAERRIELPAIADAPIRVVLGPQDDEFADDAKKLFLDSEWKISATSDRMGYRLEGPVIKHLHGHNIVSDGTVNGSIQVPGNGQPIVLMPDRGTSGGYPKIATVISADLGRFAQIPAGPRFPLQGRQHGRSAGRGAQIRRTCCAPCPTGCARIESFDLNIEALSDANVAGHAVSAVDAATWQVASATRDSD